MNPKLYIQMATSSGPKQFKAWVEQNADKYASVTMNLGWHLWSPFKLNQEMNYTILIDPIVLE